MSNIRIYQLPEDLTPIATDVLPVDSTLGGTTRKVPLPNLADIIRPVASEPEAEAGADNTKTMTPLRTEQSIAVNAESGNFTPAGAGGVTRTIRDKFRERGVSVLDFGAVLDGVADDTAAFQAALATGLTVFFPSGRAKITDKVTIQNYQRLHGAGRLESIFVIDATFNLAATAVISFTGGNDKGMTAEDFGIEHYQPDTAVRADLISYPPSIYMQSCPRVKLRRIRIVNARTGIDARGNTGGSIFEDLEISAYDYHTRWSTALDTVKLLNVHVWPFAPGVGTPLTTNQRAIMAEPSCVGHEVDGVTDWQGVGGLIFGVGCPVWLKAGFGIISAVNWDAYQGYSLIEGGNWSIGAPHASAGSGSTQGWVKMTGGALTLTGLIGSHAATTTTDPIIEAGGTANLTIAGSRFSTGSANVPSVAVKGTAVACLSGMLFSKSGTFTQPVVSFEGDSSGSVSNSGPTQDAANNTAQLIRIDTTGNVTGVENNRYRNYTLVQTLKSQVANTGRDLPRPNYIINGDFQVWQRGTSFASIGNNTYWADMWRTIAASTALATVERIAFDPSQTVVPGSPKNHARITFGAAATFGFAQRIEDVRTLAGQRVTVSFKAKSSASLTLGHFIRQNFGTGSATAQVSLPQNTFTLTTEWALYQASIDIPALASGVDIKDKSFLAYEFSTGTGAIGQTVDITDMKLEAGPAATTFQRELYSDVLTRCLAYFERFETTNAGQSFGAGLCLTTTTARVHLGFFPKRWPATITYGGTVQAVVQPTTVSVSSISFTSGIRTSRANVTVASGFTAGDAVDLIGGATSAFIDVSAEL